MKKLPKIFFFIEIQFQQKKVRKLDPFFLLTIFFSSHISMNQKTFGIFFVHISVHSAILPECIWNSWSEKNKQESIKKNFNDE